MFKLNNQVIDINRDLTIGSGDDAITYPANSLRNAELRAALGIIEEADPDRMDDRFYWNGDINTPRELPSLHNWAVEEVKKVRQAALDTFPKSSGVSSVYDENLKAAQAHAAGTGTTTIMRDGTTADEYLGHMASGMGITTEQFAAYVISENQAAATKAREIEAEYVRLAYTYIPGCSFEDVQTVVVGFAAFCQERTTATV